MARQRAVTAQEAAAIARRKAIYEELHPETKAGTAGGLARQGLATDKLSFADATSDATGKDKRSIERAAARGEALGDDLAAIACTSLDKGLEVTAQASYARQADKERLEKVAIHIRAARRCCLRRPL